MATQPITLEFEDIVPWGTTGGDNGLTSRLKIKRNFDRIKMWADAMQTFWQIDPNDPTAIFTSYNVWSQGSVSALGNADDEGGGDVELNEPLATINAAGLGTPTTAGVGLVWNGTAWVYSQTGGTSHTHENKAVLDLLTQTALEHWDLAYTNNHTHGNKAVLDSLGQTDLDHWNAACDAMHTHGNKTLLDSLQQTDLDDWNTAYNASHTHSNKTLLDSLQQTDLNHWDSAYSWGDHSLEGYLKSVAFADLTSHPTTLSGYGITDAIPASTTWWGASINNGAVTGSLSGVGDISMSGSVYMQATGALNIAASGQARSAIERSSGGDLLVGLGQSQMAADTILCGDTVVVRDGVLSVGGFVIENDNGVLKFNGSVYATGGVSALGQQSDAALFGDLSVSGQTLSVTIDDVTRTVTLPSGGGGDTSGCLLIDGSRAMTGQLKTNATGTTSSDPGTSNSALWVQGSAWFAKNVHFHYAAYFNDNIIQTANYTATLGATTVDGNLSVSGKTEFDDDIYLNVGGTMKLVNIDGNGYLYV